MDGKISIDRRYTLGDYKYMTLEDSIGGIPAKLMLNPKFLSSARVLQLISFEMVYARYMLIKDVLLKKSPEETLEILERMKDKELESLHKIINGTSLAEEFPQEDNATIEEI